VKEIYQTNNSTIKEVTHLNETNNGLYKINDNSNIIDKE
jgi:hypothetical protein